jgi:prepilin-type N-terminal cleavage/methylation domain-containing protein
VKKNAFTALELLAVMAITAVLLAILLPSVKHTKELSRLIVCASNLRQNYLLLSFYAGDFNGYWPKTDSPIHTNQFHNINSQQLNSPLYYLWKSGYTNQPQTWYCPAGDDKFENNWETSRCKLRPVENSAAYGYQYRMYFAYNFPDIKTTAIKKRQYPESIGYIRPAQHRNLAILSDTFNAADSGTITNHQNMKKINVLFNDSAVAKRYDTNSTIAKLDVSWQQAGDWRIPLANGSPDNTHSVARIWNFFDAGNWQ